MKKIKILFVVNNFDIGGPQKSLLSLLYELENENYDIYLLSLGGNGQLHEYLPEFIKVIPVDPVITFNTLQSKSVKKNTLKYLFNSNKYYARKAIKNVIIGKRKKSMVKSKQSHWLDVRKQLPKLDGHFHAAIGVSGGHSMMYINDCVEATKKIGWIRTDYRVLKRNHDIDREYFNNMDSIISVSEMCEDIFIKIFPEAAKKTVVMYNPLPFKMYNNIKVEENIIKKADEDELKLLTICRLDEHKGLDLAVEALEILVHEENKKHLKWYILGEGSYRRKLEHLIKEKSLENNMILLGSHINTGDFIKHADIIVHPSRFEGKSNVIDEAKHLNKVIVATEFTTVNEQLTHKSTGIITKIESSELAKAISKLIKDSHLRNSLINTLKELDKGENCNTVKIFKNIIER